MFGGNAARWAPGLLGYRAPNLVRGLPGSWVPGHPGSQAPRLPDSRAPGHPEPDPSSILHHGKAVSKNLLNQEFTAAYPNQKWVSDITYIPTKEGWLYLCVFMIYIPDQLLAGL